MKFFLILISFCLVAFGQPAWIASFGSLAAALGFALFWRGMLFYTRPRDRFFLSLIWFSCVQGVQLSWMTTMDYMGPLILIVYFFLIVGMGAQFGLLSFLFEGEIRFHKALAIAGSWVLLEWIRLFFLCGFTWNLVGLSLASSSFSLQFASVWGVFGLSFWVILVNLLALNALLQKSKKSAAVWASLALVPYLYGFIQQTYVERTIPISKQLRVALVQTALFPEQKDFLSHSPDQFIPPLEQWERIWKQLDLDKQVDLIVFPEAALPLGAHKLNYDLTSMQKYFHSDSYPPIRPPYALFNRGKWQVTNAFLIQALANELNSHVIVGLDDVDYWGKYNAAFHFQPKNLSYERYEKRILVPLAEYIPLRRWPFIVRFAAEQFGIYSSFDPGHEAKVFKAQIPIGVSICLEETFSHLIRDLRVNGAQLFVNLTNDIWFPRSKLPEQHFDHGRIRAVENGVCILRACNSGVTGGVDCLGRPMQRLPISEERASVLYLTLPVRSFSTLYTWWGDWAILGISSGALASYFLFRKKKLP